MLKSLQVTNFRGLEKLELKRLNRVNLIVGDNNTGKTSVLEALYLLLGNSSQITHFAESFRATEEEGRGRVANHADTIERFWMWLFRDHNSNEPFSISAEIRDRPSFEVVCALKKDGSLACFRRDGQAAKMLFGLDVNKSFQIGSYSSGPLRVSRLSVRPSNPVDDADDFNRMANRPGGEEAAEEYMRSVEPRLRKLRYRKLRQGSKAVVYAELEDLPEFIPSTQMGQAFTRVLHIYCEVKLEEAGVLLADEIENGIYFGNLMSFWRGLLTLADQQDAQLFATTHSFECLKSAHQAACERADKGGTYDLNIIRLDRMDWGIKATEFGREEMEAAILNGWEMR